MYSGHRNAAWPGQSQHPHQPAQSSQATVLLPQWPPLAAPHIPQAYLGAHPAGLCPPTQEATPKGNAEKSQGLGVGPEWARGEDPQLPAWGWREPGIGWGGTEGFGGLPKLRRHLVLHFRERGVHSETRLCAISWGTPPSRESALLWVSCTWRGQVALSLPHVVPVYRAGRQLPATSASASAPTSTTEPAPVLPGRG